MARRGFLLKYVLSPTEFGGAPVSPSSTLPKGRPERESSLSQSSNQALQLQTLFPDAYSNQFFTAPDRIALPDIFQGLGQGLLFHARSTCPALTGKNKLVMIAFGGEHFGHVFIGDHPIVHIVAHDIRIEKVSVAHFHPDSKRLGRDCSESGVHEIPRRRAGSAGYTATAD